ncbi:hypothetical protein EVAR_81779_1 [Eumeta japonica]|uniref:Uncharacterized protein n=1 Tax=Eumeta variegata TaxID=151549 RepID=A0A4C1UHK4_EUMVA|nr:hypothetical protein EVAR_81779_1 [Eumeta japonica]
MSVCEKDAKRHDRSRRGGRGGAGAGATAGGRLAGPQTASLFKLKYVMRTRQRKSLYEMNFFKLHELYEAVIGRCGYKITYDGRVPDRHTTCRRRGGDDVNPVHALVTPPLHDSSRRVASTAKLSESSCGPLPFPSDILFFFQEIGNAFVTALRIRASMGGGDHQLLEFDSNGVVEPHPGQHGSVSRRGRRDTILIEDRCDAIASSVAFRQDELYSPTRSPSILLN